LQLPELMTAIQSIIDATAWHPTIINNHPTGNINIRANKLDCVALEQGVERIQETLPAEFKSGR
jgi:hypothetical protein